MIRRRAVLLMAGFLAGCSGEEKDIVVVEYDDRNHASYRSFILEATPERRLLGSNPTVYCILQINGEPMLSLLRSEDRFYALHGSGRSYFVGKTVVWHGQARMIQDQSGISEFDLALRRQSVEAVTRCR